MLFHYSFRHFCEGLDGLRTQHKKWSFPLKIFSVNVTKFGIFNGKLHFSCNGRFLLSLFNPIQDRPFRGCLRMGGVKISPSLISVTRIMKWNLSKKDPKIKKITWHTPWVLLISGFFYWKSSTFVISRYAVIDCILMHNL